MSNTIESLRRAIDCAARAASRIRRCAFAACIAGSLLACATDPGSVGIEEVAASAGASAVESTGWCEVQTILQRKCQRCHGSPPSRGAPFSLVSYEDTQRVDSRGKARYESIASALEAEYMPPQFIVLDPPVAPLEADERGAVMGWIRAGAVTESASCPNP